MEKDLIISCPECGNPQQEVSIPILNDIDNWAQKLKLVCTNKGCPVYMIEFDLDWKSK